MMNNSIQTIVSLSISGSILALILFAMQLLLRNKASKGFQYYIWLLVLLRFVLPFSFDNSIMNQLFPQALIAQAPSVIDSTSIRDDADSAPIITAEQGINGNLQKENIYSNIMDETVSPASMHDADQNKTSTLSVGNFLADHMVSIWLLGAVIHFCWFVVSYLRFFVKIRKTFMIPHQKDLKEFQTLRGSARIKLFCSQYVQTPMLLGFFSPCIVVPQLAFVQNGMQQELKHILIHELAHHRRHDLLYKWFTVLISSLHWFNPLMILMRREINRACELACDESVLTQLETDEWPRYGETLLALATNKRLPMGIVTTTMCEEKRKLKERLVHIMNYKKKATGMIALSVAMAILLAGCGIALGASGNSTAPSETVSDETTPSETVSDETGPSPTETILPNDETYIPVSSSLSVAVDDFNAFVKEDFAEDPYTLLKVTLDDGSSVEKKYEGTWISQASTGDVDGDGKQDIILYLEVLGSSGYGNGEAHVLHIVDNELVEYPKNYIQNPAIDRECPKSFEPTDTGAFRVLIGASSINVDGRDLLRIKHWLIDSVDSDDVIQYTDAYFNGEGWKIEDAGLVSGEDMMAQIKYQTLSNELEPIHRQGFKPADLTFIFNSKNPVSDKRDPDKQYYFDDEKKTLMPTLRESAHDALQQLYDMTGYLVEKCYVISARDTLLFSMDKNDFNFGTFFSYSINPILTSEEGVQYPWNLTISYKNAGSSPIDATKIVSPENVSSMSDDDIAKWYYENSSFGDRRKVVSTETDHNGFIRLYLENGDFYEATLAEGTCAIQNLVGPYKKGFEH